MEIKFKKHITLFKTNTEYEQFKKSNEFILPNVSFCKDSQDIYYEYETLPSVDYSEKYFTIVNTSEGILSFRLENINDNTPKNLSYKLQSSNEWLTLNEYNYIQVNVNEEVQLKYEKPINELNVGIFKTNGHSFDVKGNIMSLLYGDDFIGKVDLLQDYVFKFLFKDCVSLINAENLVLPTTTLLEGCYEGMFNNCQSLITTPKLLATTLAYGCYHNMFEGCTSLTTAPELPATTLVDACYQNMFCGCIKLRTAPELLATTLVGRCYYSMFNGCSKLNSITMLATDISASDCLKYWVNEVSSSGTFFKHPSMTTLPSGINGIPNLWEVEDCLI